MGVRYNAEKKKVGMYYSTPIYSFRCKCHLCDGWFEIQTDPKVSVCCGVVAGLMTNDYCRILATLLRPEPDRSRRIGILKRTAVSLFIVCPNFRNLTV